MMSGPLEPPRNRSTTQRWGSLDKGKGKMHEYEVDHPDKSDLNVLAHSLDNDFCVLIMHTYGVKKVLATLGQPMVYRLLCQQQRLVAKLVGKNY